MRNAQLKLVNGAMEGNNSEELTVEECKRTFLKIKDKLTPSRIAMLDLNCNRNVTAPQMSQKVFNKSKCGISCLSYGRLAHIFYNALGKKYNFEYYYKNGNPMWVEILVDFGKDDEGELINPIQWIMLEPVKKAWLEVRKEI